MGSGFSPREIVSELDKFIVGQKKAKKAVAIALETGGEENNFQKILKKKFFQKIY